MPGENHSVHHAQPAGAAGLPFREGLTYDDVLASGPPADLVPHIQRLASGAGSEDSPGEPPAAETPAEVRTPGGDTLRDYIDQIHKREAEHDPSKGPFHPGLYNRTIGDVLRDATCTPQEFNEFLAAYMPYFWNKDHDTPAFVPQPLYDGATSPELLREAYFSPSPDGELNATQKVILGYCTSRSFQETGSKNLLSIYERDDLMDFYRAADPDHILQALTSNTVFTQGVVKRFMEAAYSGAGPATAKERQDKFDSMVDWSYYFMKEALHFPDEMIQQYRNAALFRMIQEPLKTGGYEFKYTGFQEAHTSLAAISQELGVEKLAAVHERTGIINFDTYKPEQLERMLKVFDWDKKTIEHLQAGDVTVVFRDANGDYNGGYNKAETTAAFESPEGRTLYFEISHPDEMFQYMKELAARGIKPSTAVIAGHGQPGGIYFGARGEEVALVSVPHGRAKEEVAIHHRQEQLEHMVTELMQDSKGIDEPDEAKGRRRIILLSCSQGAPVRFATGEESFTTLPSTAKTLVEQIRHPRLDVYANEVEHGVELDVDGKSIIFDDNKPVPSGADKAFLEEIKLRLGSNNQVESSKMSRVQLWR